MEPSDVFTSMSNAFERLRWPIFESVHNIRVFGDTGDWKSDRLNTLPFDGHPIREQAATEVPLYQISFNILDLLEYEDCDLNFKAPESLAVRRADNGIVTVRDVVEQLSAYFITYKYDILRFKGILLEWKPGHFDAEVPSDTRVFFKGFQIGGEIDPWLEDVQVLLWVHGEFRQTVEALWGPD